MLRGFVDVDCGRGGFDIGIVVFDVLGAGEEDGLATKLKSRHFHPITINGGLVTH